MLNTNKHFVTMIATNLNTVEQNKKAGNANNESQPLIILLIYMHCIVLAHTSLLKVCISVKSTNTPQKKTRFHISQAGFE